MLNTNIIAIIIASIISTIIGSFWYSSKLFGSTWMKLSKIDKKSFNEMKKNEMRKKILLNFISTLILIFVLDSILNAFQITTISNAIITGILIWTGFIATTMLNTVLWENKPTRLYLINSTYHLTIIIVSSIILIIF